MSKQALRSFENYQASVRNFDFLGGKKVPGACDLDFVCHASTRQGDRFLVLEGKEVGEVLPLGQMILLKGLVKQADFTVVTVTGPDDAGMYTLGMDWSGRVDRDALGTLVENWFQCAKRGEL